MIKKKLAAAGGSSFGNREDRKGIALIKKHPGLWFLILLILNVLLSACGPAISENSGSPTQNTESTAPRSAADVDPSASASGAVQTSAETKTPDPSGYRLAGQAIKSLYVAGEYFDPTGLYLLSGEEPGEPITEGLTVPQEPLQAGMTEVTLFYRENAFSCPVTVLAGKGAVSFISRVTGKQEQKALEEFLLRSGSECLPNRDAEAFAVSRMLPNPCPDGHIQNRQQLADYMDYHVFYGLGSATVFFDYPCPDPEEELNDLYFRSRLIAGTAALQLHDAGGGVWQILLRYYRDQLFLPQSEGLTGTYLSPYRKQSSRSSYTSPRVRENGITVFTSDQAVYALMQGYDIAPVPGSPAEEAVIRACEILRDYGDESWNDMERLYHILLYFLDSTDYDHSGDNAAGAVPDPELEPDLFVSRLLSFRAEGPLFYGTSACYGFAKAAALLLSLEGFELTRVVSRESGVSGRSICLKNLLGSYQDVISTHSYLYVRSGGKDLLFDATYSYAGTVPFGSVTADWFRDPCLCLSCPEHREVYTKLETDWYALSEAYRPGSGARLNEVRMDGGAGLLLQNRKELDHFWEKLGMQAEAMTDGYSSASLIVKKDVFAGRSEAKQAAYDFCSRCSSSYYAAVGDHSYGGEDYYVILLGMKR